MNIALKDVEIDPPDILAQHGKSSLGDADVYTLAKTYFDLKELDR